MAGRYVIDIPIIAGYCEVMVVYGDLMTDIAGLNKENYDEYLAMPTVDRINDFNIYFLHYNHLIENKKATNRIKDLLDVQELERINKKD